MDKFIYYGYHFEAVCTNASYPVDATSEYSSVLQLKLGKLRVLMAAEIDACMDMEGRDASPVDTFVELKTVMWVGWLACSTLCLHACTLICLMQHKCRAFSYVCLSWWTFCLSGL